MTSRFVTPSLLFLTNGAVQGYKKTSNAIAQHVDEEGALKQGTLTNRGIQQMLYVNESGLYALILGSKLESTRRFKHWVTAEVLPASEEERQLLLWPAAHVYDCLREKSPTAMEGIERITFGWYLKEISAWQVRVGNRRLWLLRKVEV